MRSPRAFRSATSRSSTRSSIYNYDRPHESLDQQRPCEFYQPSARRLNENDKPLVYPTDCEVKQVSSSGFLAHEGKSYHVGEAFAQKRVGLHRSQDSRGGKE